MADLHAHNHGYPTVDPLKCSFLIGMATVPGRNHGYLTVDPLTGRPHEGGIRVWQPEINRSRNVQEAHLSKVPSENYDRIIAALVRLGFAVVRQRGGHIRLHKQLPAGRIKITVPAHRPVKRSTLSHILKQAQVSLDDFLAAL